MKRAILFLLSGWERKKCVDRETDRMLIARLEAAGYRVVRVSSLEWMHAFLCMNQYNAVIVSRRFCDAHKFEPDRHLREADSEHIIVVWDRDASGAVTCAPFQNPEFARQANPAMAEFLGAGSTVARALETSPAIRAEFAGAPLPPPYVALATGPEGAFPDPESPELHRKQALVLDAISAGGTAGADVATIERRVWGTCAGKRKKDIQIYVSKLRRYLSTRDGTRCTIAYRDRRYYLAPGR